MTRGFGSSIALTVMAIVATALMLLGCSAAPTSEDFKGTAISGERQAQDFLLTDQFGASKSLRRDFAGKTVALTFLYTDCPDVCPIVANHLRDISALLEDDASQTAIIIVSVDPARDTVDSAHAYSERWGMTDSWTYLVGDEDALSAVWKAYYIDPYIHGPGKSEARADSAAKSGQGGGVSALAEQTGRVIHSAPIYIIDADGIMRSAFTLPLDPKDVAHDIQLISR